MVLKKYKELIKDNERLRAENEALKKLAEHSDKRMVKQWENFLQYDGTPQAEGGLNED